MTLKEQTKQKIEDTKELILQMIPTRTSELINDTDYNYGYLDSNLILHLLNVNATLSSSQTIVSNGSTMTISALVTDSDGNTVSNAPVQFYINGTASGNPINTNSNGIATYTYSGTGIGKVKIYAKVGTFQSEIYDIWDTLFYDNGTLNDHNSNWNNTSFEVSRSDKGTLLSSLTYATYYADNPSHTGLYDWDSPFAIEMVIVSEDGANFQIYDNDNSANVSRTFSELGITSNNHLMIVNDGSTIKFYVDGVEKTAKQYTGSTNHCRVGFRVNNGGNVTYNNFKIYLI